MYMLGSNYPNVLKGRVLNKNNNYGLLSQSVWAAHAYIITDVLMKDFCNRCLLLFQWITDYIYTVEEIICVAKISKAG